MKTTCLFIILAICSLGLSQSIIDTKIIEQHMWNMTNAKRVSNGFRARQYCDVSKKAADMQVDYLKKQGIVCHESNINVKNKVLKTPAERFNFFNTDSILIKNASGKIAPINFDCEVVSYHNTYFSKDSSINFRIAKDIYEGFSGSKMHNYLINFSPDFPEYNPAGNYSVRVLVVDEDETTVHLITYCVGVFSDIYIYPSTNH